MTFSVKTIPDHKGEGAWA
ncbi:NinH protein [Enterobacteria phage SfI]|uniref:NinH protein n=1 Tax=Escherichia phage 21 TaxID=2910191 RepID=Q9XJQ5_9CAUD|nr:NinH protein [Enterobacteria phage SfI]AFR52503.1 NinH protein [Enterobacteria phage SfI]CAB39992.1 NinH protein [Escherichia phage 21]